LTVSVRDLLSAKTKDLLKHTAEEDLIINIYSNMYIKKNKLLNVGMILLRT